jgi:hypothetical protein
MQNYADLAEANTLQASRTIINNNLKTAMSQSSGTAFPTTNLQLGMPCWRSDLNKLYVLRAISPTTWEPMYSAESDGAGSGLDADLLDGQQGSYYTAIATRLGYTPANLAGDTFTGVVNVDAGNVGGSGTDVFQVRANSGNFGMRISVTGNLSTDFAVTRYFQGGAQKAATYTNLDNYYINVGGNVAVRVNQYGITTFGAATAGAFAGSSAVQSASTGTPYAGRNTSTVGGKYWLFGPDSSNNYVVQNQGSVGVFVADGATSWSAISDERKKTALEPITDAVEKVEQLRAVTGLYKGDYASAKRRTFLIAQDVQKVLPEAVTEVEGTLCLAYSDVIPLLVASVKELSAEVNHLKLRLAAIEPWPEDI